MPSIAAGERNGSLHSRGATAVSRAAEIALRMLRLRGRMDRSPITYPMLIASGGFVEGANALSSSSTAAER